MMDKQEFIAFMEEQGVETEIHSDYIECTYGGFLTSIPILKCWTKEIALSVIWSLKRSANGS